MADKRDADDAIRKLDDTEFGYKRRRLKIQWAKVRLISPLFHSPHCAMHLHTHSHTQFSSSTSAPDLLHHTHHLPFAAPQYVQQAEADRKRDVKPSQTIFIVNFDVQRVRERDLDRHFEYFGRIKRIEIKRNYAFIQVGGFPLMQLTACRARDAKAYSRISGGWA